MKRILRVLEYIGSDEWVDKAISKRAIKGSFSTAGGSIHEAILGDVPELLLQSELETRENQRQVELGKV